MADEEKVIPEESKPTLEQLQAELAKLKEENGKLKNAQSNASADAAKYKRELQSRMSEQEKAENATKELIEQLKADNERMKREQEVAVRTAQYAGLGFDGNLAKQAAEAWGIDHESFTASFKTFLAAHDKALLADQLRATPRPGTGAVEPTITKEQFSKMKYAERVKFFEEQPELYAEFTK